MEKHALRELYEKYGETVIFDPKKLRAHLLDLRLPKKSINLLVDISRIDGFRQFAGEIVSDEGAREKLIYAIGNEYALEQSAVKFGADCWVYAFTGGSAGDYDDYDYVGEPAESEAANGVSWTDDTAELVATALRELMKE